jgi:hypothetical protein
MKSKYLVEKELGKKGNNQRNPTQLPLHLLQILHEWSGIEHQLQQ